MAGRGADLECGELRTGYRGIPYSSIVGVRLIGERAVHIFTHRDDLSPKRIAVTYATAAEAFSAAEEIRHGIRLVSEGRPRRLLLVVNPVAGNGRSRRLVARFLKPFFEELAGIQLTVIETREEFQEDGLKVALRHQFDGYVAVGGDGVFGYLVNSVRDVFQTFPAPLAHVPTGSTDAVASTVASRMPFASAICTALSRRSNIDYLDVAAVTEGVTRTTAAVCICATGFMAETIALSESYRNFGPLRNDIAGFVALLRNRSQTCNIRYVESAGCGLQGQATACDGAACEKCQASVGERRVSTHETPWKSLHGEFLSVMILNHACKSDKTPVGMLWRAHLGDGAAFLVCVKKCHPLRYLFFLLSMSLFGMRSYDKKIVDIIPVVEAEVTGASVFNVDGELVTATDAMRVSVKHKGLPLFAK